MKTQEQQALKMYAKAREDFQAQRKSMDNRLGRKADGEFQKTQDSRYFSLDDMDNFVAISGQAKKQENEIAKM